MRVKEIADNFLLDGKGNETNEVIKKLEVLFEREILNENIVDEIADSISVVTGHANKEAASILWLDFKNSILLPNGIIDCSMFNNETKKDIYRSFVDYAQGTLEDAFDLKYGEPVNVTITESLSKTISVRGKDEEEAYCIVKEKYYNEEIVLNASNFLDCDIDTEKPKKLNYFYRMEAPIKEGEEVFALVPNSYGVKPKLKSIGNVIDYKQQANNFIIHTNQGFFTNNDVEYVLNSNNYDIGITEEDKANVYNLLIDSTTEFNNVTEATFYVFLRETHTYSEVLKPLAKLINVRPLFEKKEMYNEDDIDNMLKVAREHKTELEPYIIRNSSKKDKEVLLQAINEPDFFAESFTACDSDICEQFLAIMERFNDDKISNAFDHSYENNELRKSL